MAWSILWGRALNGNRRASIRRATAIVTAIAAFCVVPSDLDRAAARSVLRAHPLDLGGCCLEIVSALPSVEGSPGVGGLYNGHTAASRLRFDSRFLAPGVAQEQGLQVRTILAARAISAAFPQIHEIGGVRPDRLRWHPQGLALDVMIPDAGSRQGIELGNSIVAFVLKNAQRFGMQDAIWRGTYYTPTSARRSSYGHYDHVHVTTTGGGYPTGGEIYLR